MLTALLYGLAASSALVIGALTGSWWRPSQLITATLLAFASGALISALSFELFEEAFRLGGAWRSGLGLLAGAVTFVVADLLLSRYMGNAGPARRGGTRARTRIHSDARTRAGKQGRIGFALLAAVTLDGVPENLALGVSLVGGVSLTLLIAIFFSNLPESMVGAVAMREAGESRLIVIGTWSVCAALLTAAVVLGRYLTGGLGDPALAIALSFAGGAVLASLADTLMPEAFEHGFPLNALATAAGFFLSFVLAG